MLNGKRFAKVREIVNIIKHNMFQRIYRIIITCGISVCAVKRCLDISETVFRSDGDS